MKKVFAIVAVISIVASMCLVGCKSGDEGAAGSSAAASTTKP